ncbi:MAG TPA: hypothetical protein VE442_01475 [Jatrophihabitans sp.]|nr:hypothetical protein [Jatrophihabitans sp.]
MSNYDAEITELQNIIERLRTIRTRTCEPKANTNPRYLGLSTAVAGINKAIDDMRREG